LYVEKTVWRVVLLRVNTQILSTVDSKWKGWYPT
jgi:hypothetical protein